MSKAQEIMVCGHCGKQAVFSLKAQNDGTPDWSEDYSGQEITVWRVVQCTSCWEVTLERSRIDYSFDRNDLDGSPIIKPITAEKKILYPVAKKRTPLTNLPMEIEKEYEDT